MRIIFIVLFSFILLKANFLDSDNIGNFSECFDVKFYSMGNCFLFSRLNPSYFEGTTFLLGSGCSFIHEERSVWIFDNYNNTIGKSVIAMNDYISYGPFALMTSFETEFFRFGINYNPVIQTFYRFHDVRMDEFYVIVSELEEKKEILVYGLTPNFGLRYGSLSGGFSISVLFGDKYKLYKTLTDTMEEKIKYKGITYGGGFTLEPNKKIKISLNYNNSLPLTSDTDSILYPKRISLGTLYSPPNILPVQFILQVDYEFWEEVKVNGVDQNYKNILIYRLGVQHKLTSGFFARLGYVYKNHYSQNIPIGMFTFGVGLEYNENFIDFGIGFEGLSFKKGEVFFNENETDLKVSIRRNL